MNAFAQQLLGVAKGYLGPAAQTFLSTEFQALGVNANTVSPAQLEGLVERVRTKASRAMGEERASELASALSACGLAQKKTDGGHRLANDAPADPELPHQRRFRRHPRAGLERTAADQFGDTVDDTLRQGRRAAGERLAEAGMGFGWHSHQTTDFMPRSVMSER